MIGIKYDPYLNYNTYTRGINNKDGNSNHSNNNEYLHFMNNEKLRYIKLIVIHIYYIL